MPPAMAPTPAPTAAPTGPPTIAPVTAPVVAPAAAPSCANAAIGNESAAAIVTTASDLVFMICSDPYWGSCVSGRRTWEPDGCSNERGVFTERRLFLNRNLRDVPTFVPHQLTEQLAW